MGFTDTEVNRRLLAAYGGDVEAVITLLLNSGGDPNLLEVTHEGHKRTQSRTKKNQVYFSQ